MTVFGLPAWALALVVAGLSPFAASAWGKLVEKRVRDRTARAVRALHEPRETRESRESHALDDGAVGPINSHAMGLSSEHRGGRTRSP